MSHRASTASKSVHTSAAPVPAHRMPTKISPRKTPAQANQRRIGKYQVARALHKGRVSNVVLGKITGIGGVERSVAIKLLRSRFADDKRFVDGLLHEERVTSSLQHPNIVQLIDSGESEYGYYMAMEHIQGWNLAEIMEASSAASKPIPLDVALTIAHGVASGLHYLHDLLGARDARVRMVHRDVQPANLMLSETGFIKLIDFGGVTIEGMDRQDGLMLASVSSYTPPEVTSNRLVDRRGDIYGLGVLLYEMVTGRGLLRDEHTGEVVPPSAFSPDLPADLQELILRMVQADPDRRLQSAASLQYAFEELAAKYRFSLSHRQVAHFARRLMERRASASRPAKAPRSQPTRKPAGKRIEKPARVIGSVRRELKPPRRQHTDMRKTSVHISRHPR